MYLINNRSFLIVKPLKPLLDWIRTFEDYDLDEEEILNNKKIYLVEDSDIFEEKELTDLIKAHYSVIFQNELFTWNSDSSVYPKDMSFESFKKYFSVEFVDMAYDLLEDEIEIDHLED